MTSGAVFITFLNFIIYGAIAGLITRGLLGCLSFSFKKGRPKDIFN